MNHLNEHTFQTTEQLLDDLTQKTGDIIQRCLVRQCYASLVVGGGRTPRTLFTRLSRMNWDWPKIYITLSDERWVAPDHKDSNEKLVRDYLLKGLAQKANFIPLKTNHPTPEAGVLLVKSRLMHVPKPYGAVILGMGEDGHTASLFPGCAQLKAGLSTRDPCIAVHPVQGAHARMSLTLSEILNTGYIMLLITGETKWQVYQKALSDLSDEGVLEMPVRAILRQTQTPVSIYWAP